MSKNMKSHRNLHSYLSMAIGSLFQSFPNMVSFKPSGSDHKSYTKKCLSKRKIRKKRKLERQNKKRARKK